jgi:hypothetical protein
VRWGSVSLPSISTCFNESLIWLLQILTSRSSAGVQLALNDIAPTYASLGTLNAIALTVVSALRAFAPALFSSIFATGARMQLLNGYLVWLVLIILALAFTVAIRWLPEKAEGKLKQEEEEEEQIVR